MRSADVLAKRADLSGDRLAVVDAGAGREIDYASLDERAARCAAHLSGEAGVGAGDRVAVLAHNGAELIELLFACSRIGALLVPLNWRLAVDELEGIVADCGPTLLAADGANAETAAALAERCDLRLGLALRSAELPGATGYEEALAASRPAPPAEPPDEDAPWYLLYTSGTTGRPKGVVQTLRMAVANFLNIGLPIGLSASDTTLNVLPMFHTGGLNLYTLPTLIAGGTAIVPAAFDPAQVLDLLERRATAFFGVPAIYQALAGHERFAGADLGRVRSWASGGAPLPASLIERYAELGVTIRQGFGMTETGPTVFLIDTDRALAKAGSVGRPQLVAEVRIVDASGRDVDDGEAGELLVRGPGVTPGYWQRPDADDEAFAEGGWLRSGDVARRDAEGDYWIVDRVKDMFISGGENVYPAEVERVLDAHPAVAEAAVVGVPDQRWGEVGKAVLVASGDAGIDLDALRAYLRERLAGYKVPAHFQVADALPRNAAGKVLKQELGGMPGEVARTRLVGQPDLDAYARLSGDGNPIHVDAERARRSRFGTTVAHGMLLAALLDGVLADAVDWPWRAMALTFPAATPAGTEVSLVASPAGESAQLRVVTADGTTTLEGIAASSAEALPEGVLEAPAGPAPDAQPWAALAERRAETRWTVTADVAAEYARLVGAQPSAAPGEVPLPLVAAALSRLLGTQLPGPGTSYLKQSLALVAPVSVGEELTASVEVTRIRADKGLVDLRARCYAENGTLVGEGRALVLASEADRLRGGGDLMAERKTAGPVRIAYEIHDDAGPDAPWAVLVHGLGYSRAGWGPAVAPLARRLRLVLLDNRGIGGSDVPEGPYSATEMASDVVAVLDDAGIERAHIVGTSLGGMIAQELAVEHPERVGRLVLGCSTPGGDAAVPMPEATQRLIADAPSMGPVDALRALVANALSPRARERDPGVVDRILALRLETAQDPQGWQAQAFAGTTYDAGDRLARIEAPTLVLHGTADTVVDPDNADLLAERIPSAQVVWFGRAGHLLFWEEPERFATVVADFLTEEKA